MPYGRHGRGRGQRGGFRMLDPIILLALHREPAHGYMLMEYLASYGAGHRDISVLYRNLHRMEEAGWVTSSQQQESSQGPPRRVYQITPQGEQVLQQYISDLEQRLVDLQKIIHDYKAHMKDHHSG